MKRALVVFLTLVLGALSAQAAYRLCLTDGKVIILEEKPVLQGDLAYFMKSGVTYYLPASQIDQAKTDRENGPAEAQPQAVVSPMAPPAPKAPLIDEDQLDIIRKRSRLANEGELEAPPPAAQPTAEKQGEGATMSPEQANAAGKASGQQRRAAIQSKLTDLLAKQATATQQQNDLRTQISALTDKYNFSTQQTDQAAIQTQIDGLQRQLDDARNQSAALLSQIQATQQELASIPVVVQEGRE